MNIRTKERRVIVAHNYNVEVVAYLTLFNNQKIKSAAGGIVKNRYFIFRLTNKVDDSDTEIIYCGYRAGESLCSIAGINIPARFNPLAVNHQNRNNFTAGNGSNSGNNRVVWDNTRKQLYDAVMLLISFLGDQNPDSFLFSIKSSLEETEHIGHPPSIKMIKAVNNVIHKIKKFNSLRDIINYLHKKGNNVRTFQFDLLIEKLNAEQIPEFFENK